MIRKILSKYLKENDSNSTSKYLIFNSLMCLFIIIASLAIYKYLPSTIPIMHQGAKDIYVAKEVGIWMLPIVSIILNVILYIQKRINVISSLVMAALAIFTVYTYVAML